MSESRLESGLGAISRFRAVVVAALKVKQLRRGSKPRFELDGNKHEETCIAMDQLDSFKIDEGLCTNRACSSGRTKV